MNKMYPYIITDDCVTVYIDGEPIQVLSDSSQFKNVLEGIRCKDWVKVQESAEKSKVIKRYLKSSGGTMELKNGTVYYRGNPTDGIIVDKIIQMYDEGFDPYPMMNFLENLLNNPSHTAVQELYLFLASGHLPITEDGCFLAYKNVREDYFDKHSGTVRYKVGDRPSMPRNKVDDNRNNLCSTGLHFCSIEYLNKMWGHSGRTMVVKINPADVVSIPADYNNTKGRAWIMEVIGEIDSSKGEFSKASVLKDEEFNDTFKATFKWE